MSKNNKWGALSMQDKAFLIREGVRNGITNLDEIRDLYNQSYKFDGTSDNPPLYYTDDPELKEDEWLSNPDTFNGRFADFRTAQLEAEYDRNKKYYDPYDILNTPVNEKKGQTPMSKTDYMKSYIYSRSRGIPEYTTRLGSNYNELPNVSPRNSEEFADYLRQTTFHHNNYRSFIPEASTNIKLSKRDLLRVIKENLRNRTEYENYNDIKLDSLARKERRKLLGRAKLASGEYHPKHDVITYSWPSGDVKVHEQHHFISDAADDSVRRMTGARGKSIYDVYTDAGLKELERSEHPEIDKLYYSRGTEFDSRIKSFQYANKLNPKHTVTKEDLDKLRWSFRNHDLHLYKDEYIIDRLNSIYKDGGKLNKKEDNDYDLSVDIAPVTVTAKTKKKTSKSNKTGFDNYLFPFSQKTSKNSKTEKVESVTQKVLREIEKEQEISKEVARQLDNTTNNLSLSDLNIGTNIETPYLSQFYSSVKYNDGQNTEHQFSGEDNTSGWARFKAMNTLQGGEPGTPILTDYRELLNSNNEQATDILREHNKDVSDLNKKAGKATVNNLAFMAGFANPFGIAGDLGITAASALLGGDYKNFWKNLGTGALFDLAGGTLSGLNKGRKIIRQIRKNIKSLKRDYNVKFALPKIKFDYDSGYRKSDFPYGYDLHYASATPKEYMGELFFAPALEKAKIKKFNNNKIELFNTSLNNVLNKKTSLYSSLYPTNVGGYYQSNANINLSSKLPSNIVGVHELGHGVQYATNASQAASLVDPFGNYQNFPQYSSLLRNDYHKILQDQADFLRELDTGVPPGIKSNNNTLIFKDKNSRNLRELNSTVKESLYKMFQNRLPYHDERFMTKEMLDLYKTELSEMSSSDFIKAFSKDANAYAQDYILGITEIQKKDPGRAEYLIKRLKDLVINQYY